MAPTLLFDISGIDPDQTLYDAAQIEAINPHRGDMRMLDRIAWASEDHRRIVAARDVGHDEFWVPGHIPGRPIFPGVLMIEAGGQLASFQYGKCVPDSKLPFLGFAGLDNVKFRGRVGPGDTFVLLAELLEIRSRRVLCNVQGCTNGTVIFEGKVTGMPV